MTRLFIVKRDADGLFPLADGSRTLMHDLPPGAMWRCDCHGELGWLIMLPDHEPWCTLLGDEQGRPWDVSGEAPNLTVSPSINHVKSGGWHGHIQNGELTAGSFNP
ncbi:MAG TPA: hypothetical protein VGU71_22520 [Candidatus Dormibacteraeota bacterium]|nr:hypothetical protein [Candidatus Dormibacteraeota bacterium]